MGFHKVMAGLAAAVAIAAAAPGASAQEFRGFPPGDSRIELLQEKEARGLQYTVSLQGRVSIPLGTVDPDLNVDYGDLFKTGLGLSVEASVLWPVGPKWHFGPYLSVGWDSFDGKTSTDEVGDSLTPDTMDITTFLVGGRGILQLGPQAQLDLHMAFGAAHYGEVGGTFVSAGIPPDVIVFKSSTKFAFDLGVRFNVVTGPVFFDGGIDLRSQGAPTNGDFDFNSGPLVTFALEFGVGVRF
jgi:hypothetical protein